MRISGSRRRYARLSGVNSSHRFHGVGVLGALVVAVALHPCKPQCQTTRIARARLQVAEGNLRDQLWADIHGPFVTMSLAREKLLRLPFEHGIGEAFEGLAEHD